MKQKKPKTLEIPMVKSNEVVPVLTGEAEKIWQEVKNVQLDLFALPNQTIEKYCTPQYVEPSKLYVTVSTGAVGPALEDALVKTYIVEYAGKFIVISRK